MHHWRKVIQPKASDSRCSLSKRDGSRRRSKLEQQSSTAKRGLTFRASPTTDRSASHDLSILVPLDFASPFSSRPSHLHGKNS